LRLGELLGLTVNDLNLGEEPTLRVRRQWTREGAFAPPKTPKSKRTVFIPPWLSTKLKKYLVATGKRDDDRVFAIAHSTADLSLRRHAKKAEVDVSWHDFRHTFGSRLIARGVNVYRVSRQLGHEKVSTTLDVYAHEFDVDGGAGQIREALQRDSQSHEM
jgi:integrase